MVKHSIWSPPNWSVILALVILFGGIELGRTGSENGKEDGDQEAQESKGLNSTEVKNKRNLTGIPQIDYITDPNLPRELNGYNLSDYPFYSKVPKNINFSCDGLKDGFYSSVPHKCQLYHQCLFGTRYDFLCANYTAFDQRTFICQFVSVVDCENSHMFFHRNDELYVAKSTTVAPNLHNFKYSRRGNRAKILPKLPTSAPAVTSAPPLSGPSSDPGEGGGGGGTGGSNPNLPRRDEPEDYGDYDYRPRARSRPRPCQRPRRRRPRWCRNRGGGGGRRRRPYYEDYDDYEDYSYDDYPDYKEDYKTERGSGRPKKDGAATEAVIAKTSRKGAGAAKAKAQSQGDYDYVDPALAPKTSPKPATTSSSTTPSPPPPQNDEALPPLDPEEIAKAREDLYTKSRAPPRIRPPVPRNKRVEYELMQGREPSSTLPSTTKAAPTQSKNAKTHNAKSTLSQSPKSAPLKVPPSASAPTGPSSNSQKGEKEPEYYSEDYYSEDAEDYYKDPPSEETSIKPTAAPLLQKKSNKYMRTHQFQRPGGNQRASINRGSKTFSPPSSSTTTLKTTTTTTSTTTPAPVYEDEYEYEYEYEDEEPTTSTTERAQPSPKHGGNLSTRKKGGTRSRFHVEEHDDGGRESDRAQSDSSDSGQESRYNGRSIPQLVGSYPSLSSPNLEHIKIKEALEAPSKVPSLGRPYLNRPRPTLFNSQMIQPVTSSSTSPPSTTELTTTTTSTTPPPTTTSTTPPPPPPPPPPSTRLTTQRPRTTTTLPFRVMDGFNPRFPSFDSKPSKSSRPTRLWQRNPNAPFHEIEQTGLSSQKSKKESSSDSKPTPPPAPPSMAMDDEYYDDVISTRYGSGSAYPSSSSSSSSQSQSNDKIPNHHMMDYGPTGGSGPMKLTGGSGPMDSHYEREEFDYKDDEDTMEMLTNPKTISNSKPRGQTHANYEMMNMANIENQPHLQRYGTSTYHRQVPMEHENYVTPFSSPSSASSVSMSVSSSSSRHVHPVRKPIMSSTTTARSPRLPSPEFISLLDDDYYRGDDPHKRFRNNPNPKPLPMFSSPDPFTVMPTYSLAHFAGNGNRRGNKPSQVFPHFYSYFQ